MTPLRPAPDELRPGIRLWTGGLDCPRAAETAAVAASSALRSSGAAPSPPPPGRNGLGWGRGAARRRRRLPGCPWRRSEAEAGVEGAPASLGLPRGAGEGRGWRGGSSSRPALGSSAGPGLRRGGGEEGGRGRVGVRWDAPAEGWLWEGQRVGPLWPAVESRPLGQCLAERRRRRVMGVSPKQGPASGGASMVRDGKLPDGLRVNNGHISCPEMRQDEMDSKQI